MLDANLKQQLQGLLTNLRDPIELLSSLDDSPKSAELADLLDQIATLSDKVSVQRTDDDARRPSFLIRRAGHPGIAVRFAGIPLGHEFTSLVLALLQVGGHPPKVAPEVLEQV
ncbi:MAG: alkyl hydroperoxide reductase subunit F, partial [Sphingopyxis sp.]|nr:alkyl hydroperoxide reductase subunit F [Sphingopyxis sp.]